MTIQDANDCRTIEQIRNGNICPGCAPDCTDYLINDIDDGCRHQTTIAGIAIKLGGTDPNTKLSYRPEDEQNKIYQI